MYIESRPDEMGFAEKQMRGVGNAGIGAITATELGTLTSRQLSAAADAPGGAPAPSAPPPVMMVPHAVVRDQDKQTKMAYVAAGVMVLGLAFVIYKATRD